MNKQSPLTGINFSQSSINITKTGRTSIPSSQLRLQGVNSGLFNFQDSEKLNGLLEKSKKDREKYIQCYLSKRNGMASMNRNQSQHFYENKFEANSSKDSLLNPSQGIESHEYKKEETNTGKLENNKTIIISQESYKPVDNQAQEEVFQVLAKIDRMIEENKEIISNENSKYSSTTKPDYCLPEGIQRNELASEHLRIEPQDYIGNKNYQSLHDPRQNLLPSTHLINIKSIKNILIVLDKCEKIFFDDLKPFLSKLKEKMPSFKSAQTL